MHWTRNLGLGQRNSLYQDIITYQLLVEFHRESYCLGGQ
uniref:Uncharacterized protein n=1 Tax=Manihot esculenta TaxID=3983 RepID=A0A2C9U3N8_MANES